VLFGGDAAALGTGAAAAGFPEKQIRIATTLADVRTAIAAAPLDAPVFLKGSRSYALEQVLSA
jgi:hypothetical protein